MNTTVTARHFELSDEIKALADENFTSLQKYFDRIISCDLILDVEKHRKMAEVQTKVYGQTLRATSESDDMYVSIEAAFDKASAQLLKYKGKLKHKNPKEIKETQDANTRPDTDVDSVDY